MNRSLPLKNFTAKLRRIVNKGMLPRTSHSAAVEKEGLQTGHVAEDLSVYAAAPVMKQAPRSWQDVCGVAQPTVDATATAAEGAKAAEKGERQRREWCEEEQSLQSSVSDGRGSRAQPVAIDSIDWLRYFPDSTHQVFSLVFGCYVRLQQRYRRQCHGRCALPASRYMPCFIFRISYIWSVCCCFQLLHATSTILFCTMRARSSTPAAALLMLHV